MGHGPSRAVPEAHTATALLPPRLLPDLPLPLTCVSFGKNYFLQAEAKKCISWSDEQPLCCRCRGVSRHQRALPFIAEVGHARCGQWELGSTFCFPSSGCAKQRWGASGKAAGAVAVPLWPPQLRLADGLRG